MNLVTIKSIIIWDNMQFTVWHKSVCYIKRLKKNHFVWSSDYLNQISQCSLEIVIIDTIKKNCSVRSDRYIKIIPPFIKSSINLKWKRKLHMKGSNKKDLSKHWVILSIYLAVNKNIVPLTGLFCNEITILTQIVNDRCLKRFSPL